MQDIQLDIDQAGYQLIQLLEIKTSPAPKQAEPQKELHGIPFLFDLGEIKELTAQSQDGWGQIDSRFVHKEGKEIGFGRERYKKVKEIASAFLELPERNLVADEEFAEEKIFEWVLAVYQTNKAGLNLTVYLKQMIQQSVRPYTFYFKIEPLGIESGFNFGGINIIPFTEDLVRQDFEKLPDKKREWDKYRDSFNSLIGSVVAEITVNAVESKADTIARAQASLAVNALKCFLNAESLSRSYQMLDLDFTSIRTGFSHSVVRYNQEGGLRFNLKRLNGTIPIGLTSENLERLKNKGLSLMHDFLVAKNKNDFQFLILRSIEQFGSAMSVRDLHERVVQLTSFFELFLNDENSSRSKAETFLRTKVLQVLLKQEDMELGKTLMGKLYRIRDKYLHNRILKHIDPEELLKIQLIGLGFLKYCIKISPTIKTKEAFYQHFEIPY